MAKDAPTLTPGADPVAEFDEFTPEIVRGKFDEIVEKMIERDNVIAEKEPDAFKKGKRTRYRYLATEEDAEKTVRQFQDSARKFERTGRHIASDPQGDGVGVLLHFVLGIRQSRPRKAKVEETPTSEAATDVPEEVSEESQDTNETPEAETADAA